LFVAVKYYKANKAEKITDAAKQNEPIAGPVTKPAEVPADTSDSGDGDNTNIDSPNNTQPPPEDTTRKITEDALAEADAIVAEWDKKAKELFSSIGKGNFSPTPEDIGIILPFKGDYAITSRHGWRTITIDGVTKKQYHYGIDYGTPSGTEIRAVRSGSVAFAGYHHQFDKNGKETKGFGYMVILYHGLDNSGNAVYTLYNHLLADSIKVTEGQWVGQYWKIAQSGNTGISTGPHLHYTILVVPNGGQPYSFYQKAHSGLKAHRHIGVDRTHSVDPEVYDWSNF
jgi:murein DD-endopeptidase MepM/ murein hydrolase activator NlpD